MQIDRDTLKSLQGLQEDTAEYFCRENFPMSGELYWTCVETLATAKLAELRGEVVADEV
jgi:hypothetical protein